MSKQHCRMLQVEQFFRQCRMLLRHCCRFWQQCCRFRQQCRTKFRPVDNNCFDFVERTKFRSTLLQVWTGPQSISVWHSVDNHIRYVCCTQTIPAMMCNAYVQRSIRITVLQVTRSFATAEGPARRALSDEILSTASQLYEKIKRGKGSGRQMTFKVSQGHPSSRYFIGHIVCWRQYTQLQKRHFQETIKTVYYYGANLLTATATLLYDVSRIISVSNESFAL